MFRKSLGQASGWRLELPFVCFILPLAGFRMFVRDLGVAMGIWSSIRRVMSIQKYKYLVESAVF